MSSKVQAIGAAASTLWMRAIVTAAKGALFLLLAAVLRESTAQNSPESINPGPDIIMADIPTLNQFGTLRLRR